MQKILIIVLVVAVVALSGVMVYQKLNQPEIIPVVVNQPVATTSDETAGWKIYTNSNSGFSVNYPDNWIIDSSTAGVTIKNLPVVDVVGNSGPKTKEGSIFSVSANSMVKPQTIREVINSYDLPQTDKQTTLNRIIAMNIAGENREVSRGLLDVNWQSGVGFTVGKMSYDIGYMSGSPEQFQKDISIFQKMLNSFQLTQ